MGDRLPLFLLFVAFLATFIVTRTITRMIRAGRGPFRNHIAGGVHIHHAVPGLFLLITGAFVAVADQGESPWAEISGVLVGIGASLVLDELALIIRLQDVYWSSEGQLSVQVVSLVIALLGLALLGLNPVTAGVGFSAGHAALVAAFPLHVISVLVCVRKGKYSTAALGAFVPPLAWIGALRLARPGSAWAARYDPAKARRARTRAQTLDARFSGWGLDIADLVAGRPAQQPTAARARAPEPERPGLHR
jgi:hypothetical protein